MDNLKKQGVILDHWDMWSSRNPENLVSISRQF